MPNSKRRKRLVASNKKQIERARRRIEAQSENEANKENRTVTINPKTTTATIASKTDGTCLSYERAASSQTSQDSLEEGERHRECQQLTEVDIYEATNAPGWLGGLYSWCHSGIIQV